MQSRRRLEEALKTDQELERALADLDAYFELAREGENVGGELRTEIDDNIEIDVKPDELRVETYRSTGAGGQHVNTTDSAVRITHLPTGTVVQCQNERSQHRNREMAMKMLRSKLYELEMRKRREAAEKLEDSKGDIAFGNQIRSYVLHPYRLVKDHRTKLEMGDADRVLDGDIDPFIKSYLASRRAVAKSG